MNTFASRPAALLLFACPLLAPPASAQFTGRTLTFSDTSPLENWASSVAILGDEAWVGGTLSTNAVRRFRRDAQSGAWVQVETLFKPGGPEFGSNFGGTVDVDGDWAAVGARGVSGQDYGTGAVYLYQRQGSDWKYVAKIVASDDFAYQGFGNSLDLDGDTLLVGCSPHFGLTCQAYVFERDPAGNWVESQVLLPTTATPRHRVGYRLALDGDQLVLGASRWEGQDVIGFVYERDASGVWQESACLEADPPPSAGHGGPNSIDLLDGTILIGVQTEFVGDGAAYLFEQDPQNGAWGAPQRWRDDEFSAYGRAVHLHADSAFVGAWSEEKGTVIKYRRDANAQWANVGRLHNVAPMDPNGYGLVIAGDDRSLIVGAAAGAPFSGGAAVVYRRDAAAQGVSVCSPAVPNSTGQPGVMEAWGSTLLADRELSLVANQLPQGKFGLFLSSRTFALTPNPGGSQGVLCLGGDVGRYSNLSLTGVNGLMTLEVDWTSLPSAYGFLHAQVGETWHFQAWFRDENPQQTSNFTDALAITLQ